MYIHMIMVNSEILLDLGSDDSSCYIAVRPESCNSIINNNFNITVLTFNMRSLQRNFDQFLLTLLRLNVTLDVIVLTERWLHEGSIVPQTTAISHYAHTNVLTKWVVLSFMCTIHGSWKLLSHRLRKVTVR